MDKVPKVSFVTEPKPDDLVPVKISAKWLRLRSMACEPTYITTVCRGACCRPAGRPLVTVHDSEKAVKRAIKRQGSQIKDGMLKLTEKKGCQFQDKELGLCALHPLGVKPFGCIASPFTLNKNKTLCLRRHYTSLTCFKSGRTTGVPAYKNFRVSLVKIFGEEVTEIITKHLDSGWGDLIVPCKYSMVGMMLSNERARTESIKKGKR